MEGRRGMMGGEWNGMEGFGAGRGGVGEFDL